ncbi:19cbb193-7710-4eed-a20a-b2c55a070933 [Sclerotinia trifoliorum]|uniref:19cbb193-7710-4eed-a20a-b2c55a070933 n=1 Tax=Sclerotinia trifoliorum TaxID=28548 RepID=A0A8H2W2Z4_9HELO|nr:19cbb193-7710-4eed-a20a-b2c55a070933 [Sclerotinia trifoliorum]
MAFVPPPPPKTALARYRMLSPTAALRVSPLCLGAGNFGDAWKNFMGECDQKQSEEILDYYYSAGGNFIDTANHYQNGESEQWVGEWAEKRGIRDQLVIATKYTTSFRTTDSDKEIWINNGGNGSKSLRVSVEASLKKLRTSYIDLLYIHWWDFTCSIPELMQSLNALVLSGKVLYLGISDTPAWIVSKCNQYARDHGFRQFSVYQGRWSAEYRDFERDIIDMAAEEGMGLAPWGTLGGGHFKSEEQRKSDEGRKMYPPSEAAFKISTVLEKIADEKETIITSVAMAYVMKKANFVCPIVGGRKVEHLKGNIEALSLELSDDDVKQIEEANAFDVGFPQSFLTGGPNKVQGPGDVYLSGLAGITDHVQPYKPVSSNKE